MRIQIYPPKPCNFIHIFCSEFGFFFKKKFIDVWYQLTLTIIIMVMISIWVFLGFILGLLTVILIEALVILYVIRRLIQPTKPPESVLITPSSNPLDHLQSVPSVCQKQVFLSCFLPFSFRWFLVSFVGCVLMMDVNYSWICNLLSEWCDYFIFCWSFSGYDFVGSYMLIFIICFCILDLGYGFLFGFEVCLGTSILIRKTQ